MNYHRVQQVVKLVILRSSFNQLRYASTNNFQFVTEANKPYAILKFNKSPVNSFTLESLNEINALFDQIEQNKSIKGVILTSDVNNVFTAGVDILELYKPDLKRLEQFWIAVQNFWIKLYGSKKAYIAAMNGHALALGCVIAMACDYRIMSNFDKIKMGLNAVHLGINAPSFFKNTMVNTIGQRRAEFSLGLGKLYSPQQALEFKLVDELCEPNLLLKVAEKRALEWCKIPAHARESTKQSMREETLKKLVNNRENDLKLFIQTTTDPVLQKNLEKYLNSLKNRDKKA